MKPKAITKTERMILDTARGLDECCHLGGLVDLRRLREALPCLRREAVDAALLSLRASYRVDLNIANAPTTLPRADHDAGIWIPWGDGGEALAVWLSLREGGR
jgi:hypothetical protein